MSAVTTVVVSLCHFVFVRNLCNNSISFGVCCCRVSMLELFFISAMDLECLEVFLCESSLAYTMTYTYGGIGLQVNGRASYQRTYICCLQQALQPSDQPAIHTFSKQTQKFKGYLDVASSTTNEV